MEFIVTGLSGMYSFYSFLDLKNSRNNLLNNKWKNNKGFLNICEDDNVKAISINIYEKADDIVYIGFPAGIPITIPVSEKKQGRCKEIYNIFTAKNIVLENWEFLDKYQNENYIKTHDCLKKYFANHNEIFNLGKMPIKVKQSNLINIYYTQFKTPLFSNEYHLISEDANKLINYATFAKRKPLSITSGIICIIGLGYICTK